ncbi:T9SS type A sorting domain-containing protein [Chryseobacterium oryctis]|uniref:T9SS type A sorting domain-containing protein n=1 Tax=Chryseobacterium oryctis TaxID=2952618 RepID=A0ABT3HPN1_9FLAO|nr:T9SS type A sorting domain-containing protein [Chryseobacterium oryctis]MCW3161745.1 T9SS type A sorting domain-containing protein [Chryseobacterium oryctis]
MNLRLLFGALVLTTATANAQLATIYENFDGFTSGSSTFPQNGWTVKLAANPMPYPPAPLMIVTTDTNKSIQAYSGNNSSQPSYLISPQIVTPTGDKTLSFKATLASPSPGPGSIQIGIASDPLDMSTFVAVGDLINLATVNATQNVNIPIPASTGSYIVFKFTPTASHVALQIDDVIYNTPSSLAVSDNIKSKEKTQFALTPDNSTLQFSANKEPKAIHVYSASGAKVIEGKLNNKKLDITQLQTGVYYILIEEANGSLTKSKFIKK